MVAPHAAVRLRQSHGMLAKRVAPKAGALTVGRTNGGGGGRFFDAVHGMNTSVARRGAPAACAVRTRFVWRERGRLAACVRGAPWDWYDGVCDTYNQQPQWSETARRACVDGCSSVSTRSILHASNLALSHVCDALVYARGAQACSQLKTGFLTHMSQVEVRGRRPREATRACSYQSGGFNHAREE
eukprot:468402-Prymnesium_polylepis.1